MTARRALVALLVALGLGVVAIHGTNAQAPAPGVQFVAALQDAYDALPPGDSIAASDPALQRVRAPVELAATYVQASPALAPITADLQRDPVDLTDVRLRLRTLLDTLRLPPGSVAEDPHAAQGALHDVYGQDTFRNLDGGGSSSSLLSRIGQGLVDAIRWLAGHTVGAIGLVPALILGGLVLAAILAWVLLRLRASAIGVPRGSVREEPLPRGIDADGEWRSAEEAAARGEHREAVRHAFRSALLSAARRGRLQVDAAWTTSELLARARGDADLVAALAPAAASFDHAWYSGRAVTTEDWEVARERCGAVRRLASRRAVTA